MKLFLACTALLVVLPSTARAVTDPLEATPPRSEFISRSVKESALSRFARTERLDRYSLELTIHDDRQSFTTVQRLVTRCAANSESALIFHLPANAAHLRTNDRPNITITSARVEHAVARFSQEGELLRIIPAVLPNGECFIELEAEGQLPELNITANIAEEQVQQLFQMLRKRPPVAGNVGLFGRAGGVLNFGHWYAFPALQNGSGADVEQPSGIGDAGNFAAGNYEVTIDLPAGLTAITSGVDDPVMSSGSRRRIRSLGAALREFTVTAGSDLEKLSETVDGTVVNSYFRSSAKGGGNAALHTAAESLRVFNRLFGEYPYREFDVVASPLTGGVGGMEYSGLVIVNEQFYQPMDLGSVPLVKQLFALGGLTPPPAKPLDDFLEFTVAHETAHQWWHGLVGSNAKDEAFLDEPLTNYSALLYFEEAHGAAAAQRQLIQQCVLSYGMLRLAGEQDSEAAQPTRSFAGMMQYGAVVYGKGTLFYAKLREQIGRDRLLAALRAYRARNEFGTVREPELVQALASAGTAAENGSTLTGTGIQDLERRWFHERHGDADLEEMPFDQIVEALFGDSVFQGENGFAARIALRMLGPELLKAAAKS